MHLKKLISVTLGTAMLASAAFAPTANAWSIYDYDYGTANYEQSQTAVTDDTEKLRENDNDDDWDSLQNNFAVPRDLELILMFRQKLTVIPLRQSPTVRSATATLRRK